MYYTYYNSADVKKNRVLSDAYVHHIYSDKRCENHHIIFFQNIRVHDQLQKKNIQQVLIFAFRQISCMLNCVWHKRDHQANEAGRNGFVASLFISFIYHRIDIQINDQMKRICDNKSQAL